MPTTTEKYKKLWVSSVHKCIIRDIRKAMAVLGKNQSTQLTHLRWRLAFNLYKISEYYEALEQFNIICSKEVKTTVEGEEEVETDVEIHANSNVHLIAGRCCFNLFMTNRSHYLLEHSYQHFQNAIDTMPVDLSTMFRLPALLLEFGRVLENYGAFESAMEVYTKILSNFPNYRGYFDAMYRSAIVGRHLCDLMDAKSKEDTLNKCIDMMNFLLEALPYTITDLHAMLLYVRLLEHSANPGTRFRAAGVYESIHDYCKASTPPIARADEYSKHKEWIDNARTWLLFGDILNADCEPVLAKDAYENYIRRIVARLQPGKTIPDAVDKDTCLKIAKNYASFQNYTSAIKFGEFALKQDHFDAETRSCLSKWSNVYKISLNKEVAAVTTIEMNWRNRLWTNGYRRRLKNQIIDEMETRHSENRFDEEARAVLQYFGRDKWRACFLYEHECAARIQRKFRERRKIWAWQKAQRAHYVTRASNTYRQYVEDPLQRDVRDEIRVITNHRMCPKNHRINVIRERIDAEDAAITKIKRAYMTHRRRKAIYEGIIVKRRRLAAFRERAVIRLQGVWRRKMVYMGMRERIQQHMHRVEAVVRIQRFIRWRHVQWRHVVTRAVCQEKLLLESAIATLQSVFKYQFHKYTARRTLQRQLDAARRAEEEARALATSQEEAFMLAVLRVQHAFVYYATRRLRRVARRATKARKGATLSSTAQTILKIVANDPESAYKIPGIRHNTPQFNQLLSQSCVHMRGDDFSDFDCMMLSGVVKSSSCGIQRLVFEGISSGTSPNYQFDLLPAVSKCRSLRSVVVLEGTYTPHFIGGLINEVQCENPRIKELFLEGVKLDGISRREQSELIALNAGRLLCDYFNYSLPGLSTLSLHNCGITDHHLELIVLGLEVNSSLRSFILSMNLLTDEGFVKIFNAISSNKKSSVIFLDCSRNMIRCRKAVRTLFNSYFHPNTAGVLEVVLRHNYCVDPYRAPLSIRMREEVHVAIGETTKILQMGARKKLTDSLSMGLELESSGRLSMSRKAQAHVWMTQSDGADVGDGDGDVGQSSLLSPRSPLGPGAPLSPVSPGIGLFAAQAMRMSVMKPSDIIAASNSRKLDYSYSVSGKAKAQSSKIAVRFPPPLEPGKITR